MKIAIFPGSFDPIHLGHLALAQTAADKLGFSADAGDKVTFVPSGVSPNKRRKQKTLGSIRHGWIAKALAELGDARLAVSDFESKHTVPTYTLETLQALTLGKSRDDVYLLVGTDTAERMKRWPSYDRILRIAHVVSFGREGAKGNIEAPTWPHSSTEVRDRILKGQGIEHLVPKAIVTDLTRHFLAQTQSGPTMG